MTYRHLSVLVHCQARKYGEKTAMRYRDYATARWIPVTWNAFSRKVMETACALAALGVEEQENIGIFSQNKPECLYVDFGAFANRAVSVPFYATSSKAQTRYMLNDAGIRFLFVGEQYQYDTAYGVMDGCPAFHTIIIFDRTVAKEPDDKRSLYFDEFLALGSDPSRQAVVEGRMARADDGDLANILYTSGTTGEPKGVMLHHFNYREAFRIHDLRIPFVTDKDISMNFLPLTHIFEKTWAYYCVYHGVEICVNLRPMDIRNTIKEIRPTMMCSVPRFWEKVYAAAQAHIAHVWGPARLLIEDALRTGRRHNLDYVRLGKRAPRWLHLKYKLYDKCIFSLLKREAGIERGTFFPVAGAFVSDEVCSFMHSVGVNMVVGYGLTESTATVSVYPQKGFVIGSVGEVMPDLEVKIGKAGEIMLRGKTITTGYYHKPEATARAIDPEGWFHTGDAGYLEGRTLYMTERLKDLFKTSNGKYVSPQALESRLMIDPYIDQAEVIADNRKFVSALIVPDYKAVEAYAKEWDIDYKDMEGLLRHPVIQKLFNARIMESQKHFAHYEQIKRFTLLPEPFTMEHGELTNTLKLKRTVVEQHYKAVIDRMYDEPFR